MWQISDEILHVPGKMSAQSNIFPKTNFTFFDRSSYILINKICNDLQHGYLNKFKDDKWAPMMI